MTTNTLPDKSGNPNLSKPNQKQESRFQQVSGLVTRNIFLHVIPVCIIVPWLEKDWVDSSIIMVFSDSINSAAESIIVYKENSQRLFSGKILILVDG